MKIEKVPEPSSFMLKTTLTFEQSAGRSITAEYHPNSIDKRFMKIGLKTKTREKNPERKRLCGCH
jgi:hypothetical protein